MYVINARSCQDGLLQGLAYLENAGKLNTSRNGEVMVSEVPVATVFHEPQRSIVHAVERDANIAFLLYEALWMLAGRHDVEGVAKYVKRMRDFSDDGYIFHGAYGFRWRKYFGQDQLETIIQRLAASDNDRRTVLAMWDGNGDLVPPEKQMKDVPCNLTVTFQWDVRVEQKLNMVVFCRSNDILMGTYFANAFHFGMLFEYIAGQLQCDIGTYTQISVNYHAYLKDLQKFGELRREGPMSDPYLLGLTSPSEDFGIQCGLHPEETHNFIFNTLTNADDDSLVPLLAPGAQHWMAMANAVLYAHQLHREKKTEEALIYLEAFPERDHWIYAMKNWLSRRMQKS